MGLRKKLDERQDESGGGDEKEELIEKEKDKEKEKAIYCSICLETVTFGGDRSTARLQCAHEFHLDCIGSAFNAKGVMQCPNCRKVEKGNWLYANRSRAIPDLEEYSPSEDLYDLSYSEMPFGLHWCPFGQLTHVPSYFEEGESSPPHNFPDLLGPHALFAEHVAISTATRHPCPYVAYMPPPHASSSSSLTSSPPSSSSPSSSSHHHHHHHHHLQVPLERPVVGQPLQTVQPLDFRYNSWAHFSRSYPRVSGNNGDGQSRGVHHPVFLGNGSRARNPTSLVPPLIPQFMRSEPNITEHYPPPSSNMFTSIMNSHHRANTVGPTPLPLPPPDNSAAFCLFPPNSSNSSSLGGEDVGANRFYAWERDRFAPYPLVPVDGGETNWWGPPSDSEQRRLFRPRNRSEGSSYRGIHAPRMQSFM